jgi:hypothetical protein
MSSNHRSTRFHVSALVTHAGLFWLLFTLSLCGVSLAPQADERIAAVASLTSLS